MAQGTNSAEAVPSRRVWGRAVGQSQIGISAHSTVPPAGIGVLSSQREGVAVGNSIDVVRRYQVTGLCAHVGHVKRGSSTEFLLHAKTEAVHRRDLAAALCANDVAQYAGRALSDQVWEVGNIAGAELRSLNEGGVVKDRIENEVALDTVMHHASASSNDRLVIAEQVIGETEARLGHDAAIIPTALGKRPIGGEPHSFQRIPATGNNVPVGVDFHGLGRVVGRWVEQRNLVVCVVLRRNPGEAHAVVECQSRRHLPGVLSIELELVIAKCPQRPCRRLGEAVESP